MSAGRLARWIAALVPLVAYAYACGGTSGVDTPSTADGGTDAPSSASDATADASDAIAAAGSSNASGTIQGKSWGPIATAFWIGKPSAGSLPTQIYLSEAQLDCATISKDLWDKSIGDKKLLEMSVDGTTPKSYAIGATADANYLLGSYNPTADSGSITIATLETEKKITGSFDLAFGTDKLTGAFEAIWCATGVEP